MAEFLIALAVNPVDEGRGYEKLPLHCTVVQWFSVINSPDLSERLIRGFRMIAKTSGPKELRVTSFNGTFGQDGTIPVHEVAKTAELGRLHERCMDLVCDVGGAIGTPEWVRSGYRPHITITNGICVAVGHKILARNMYLVERIVTASPYKKMVTVVSRLGD